MPKTAAPQRFEGFADREGKFFKALARHQDRDWFAAHKAEYEQGWNRPMQALMTEVRERLDPLFPRHALGPAKVFRIYRDVRFAKDKQPYKTHIGGFVPLDGASAGPSAIAPLYLHVAPDETLVAAGHYMMDGPQLARFRAAVLDDTTGSAVANIVAGLQKRGFEPGAHDTLKKTPRGVDPDHPRADLLKRKGLIVSFPPLPRDLLISRQLVPWLVKHAQRIVPLIEWLAELD